MKEVIRNLPDGKTIIPAELIINKMGSNLVVDLRITINTNQEGRKKK
jgi:hypothetical protein